MGVNITQVSGPGTKFDGMSGVLLTKMARGELVKVTPRDGSYLLGGSNSTITSGQANGVAGPETNEAGQAWILSAQVPISAVGNSAQVRFFFYGRAIGVRFRRDNSEPAVPISFAVDGRIYPPHDARLRFLDNDPTSGKIDGESHVLIDDDIPDLPDGRPHTLDVMLAVDPALSTIYTFRLLGLLCERRAGYTEAPRMAYPIGTPGAAVPTAATAIPQKPAGGLVSRGIRSILVFNSSVGALTYSLVYNATTVYAKSIPAGDSITVDFGTNVTLDGNWKHIASGAGLIYTTIGAW